VSSHNRRRGSNRLLSSLWDVTLTGGGRRTRIRQLRRGRSRSLIFTRRVPRTARRRFCVDVVAIAAGARAASARFCSPVGPPAHSPSRADALAARSR
jgi:hypothetical protein